MYNVYENCPVFENKGYKIRLISKDDVQDLIKLYSDEKAVKFCNCDNCHGGFLFRTIEEMDNTIKWWLIEYQKKGFVRFSIISKKINEVIGTIELFHRNSNDFFSNCGLLRLDLRSDYEKEEVINSIIELILVDTFMYFDCNKIATKIIDDAKERKEAFEKLGFVLSKESLIGFDGTKYQDYYYIERA